MRQGVKSGNFFCLEFPWIDISGFQNYLVPIFLYFSEFHYKPIKVSIDLTIKNLRGALFFSVIHYQNIDSHSAHPASKKIFILLAPYRIFIIIIHFDDIF